MIAPLDVWRDSRSGPTGCLAGNLVLAEIQKRTKGEVVHEKGTTFSTDDTVYVCRVCANDSYLQTDQLHFCNLSQSQYDNARKFGKKVVFLFISVRDRSIHYWELPARVVGTALSKLTPKPSSPSCFLRIYSKEGKGSFLLSSNIEKFRHEMVLSGRRARCFGNTGNQPVNAVLYIGTGKNRKRFQGTVKPNGKARKMEVALA